VLRLPAASELNSTGSACDPENLILGLGEHNHPNLDDGLAGAGGESSSDKFIPFTEQQGLHTDGGWKMSRQAVTSQARDTPWQGRCS